MDIYCVKEEVDLTKIHSQKFHIFQSNYPTYEIDKKIIEIQNIDDELNRIYYNKQIKDLILQRNKAIEDYIKGNKWNRQTQT